MHKNALVLGKFMPLHLGHLALVNFAAGLAERLTILLCVEATEPLPGNDRERWLRATYANHPHITIRRVDYNDADLPATSVSSRAVSELWTARLRRWVPSADLIVGSENYVRYVSESWGINYRIFDLARHQVSISATQIRGNPYRFRHLIAPAARPDFVQRIVLHGTESTGKSTLVARLAEHFSTIFVPETAREVVEHTDTVVFSDLHRIADRQAEAIRKATSLADGVLFIDTDYYTTLAYARYLFNRELPPRPEWLTTAEHDLCLYCTADAPYVQDGTRLNPARRLQLDGFHRRARAESDVRTVEVSGEDWGSRMEMAVSVCEELLRF